MPVVWLLHADHMAGFHFIRHWNKNGFLLEVLYLHIINQTFIYLFGYSST